jgi:hypothetical protein
MQEFTFNIDQKISMWTRSTKHIQAETQEEAEKLLKIQYYEGRLFENLDEYEFLYETQEDTEVVEVLNQDGNLINFSN